MKNFKPAIVDGVVADGYFVCEEGNLWSKKSGSFKIMRPSVAGNSPYPKVTFMLDKKPKSVRVHRVVCETFHAFPRPDTVTSADWKKTPLSVKMLLRHSYQVNHIDHDHTNYHPSNLEWVSVRQNIQKYQQHRVA